MIIFFCVQFEIQKLRIYCDPEQSSRETACEIPGVVSITFFLGPALFFPPLTPPFYLVQPHLFLL